MRRSDRLSEIIEIVQDGRLHRARDIAEKLDVSVRTIYRDFDTLVASGIPIDGERGVGYMLREPVFLPPMNLSLTELEALHLGMAIVSEAADIELQRAAAALTKKIDKVATANGTVPESWGFGVYPFAQAKIVSVLRSGKKKSWRFRIVRLNINPRRGSSGRFRTRIGAASGL